MWKAMREAYLSSSDDFLFVFPGGRLSCKEGNEHLRNSIYSLASPCNIDALIIWASSLAGAVGMDDIAGFVREKADDLPVASIGMAVDGVASVNFDAYSGMASEISHFIGVHGQRKIAFIRGPSTHGSAEERFRAYCDELDKAGIAYDDALVSSPRPWAEGEASIRELVEERGLVPGRDFTALAAASDLLLLGAQGYLVSHGVRIPDDLITGGFNGNEENLLMSVEPTTVLMPISGLARAAYSLASGRTDAHVMLPAELSVKESCGCRFRPAGRDAFISSISANAYGSGLRELALKAIEEADSSSPGLMETAERFISSGGDSSILSRYASIMDDGSLLYDALIHAERKASAREKITTQRNARVLDGFKNRLLATRSFQDIMPIMEESFPHLMIGSAFIVLYRDFSQSEMKAGFSPAGSCHSVLFPRQELLPGKLLDEAGRGIYAVEPLFYDSQELGYILLDASHAECSIIEDIRSAVSSSVRSIMLFEEARAAQEAAEKGEQAALDFYANVSEGIRQSLAEIRRRLFDDSSPRQAIFDTIVGAENLLELSLAEYEDVGFEKRFFNASLAVEDALALGIMRGDVPDSLPSIEADRAILSKAFAALLFLMHGKASLSVRLSPASIQFILSGRVSTEERNTILLAEKYAVLHSGSLVISEEAATIRLPYPTLSGASALPESGGGVIYVTSGEDVPAALAPLAPLSVPLSHLSELLAVSSGLQAVSWTSRGGKETRFLANLLRSHRDTRNVSCICFGPDAEGISLRSAIEGSELPSSTAIYSIGQVAVPPILAEYGAIIPVSSFEEAAGTAGDVRMIFIEGLADNLISRFRSSQRFASVPIVAVCASLADKGIDRVEEIPNLIVVNTSILEASGFISRLIEVLAGSGPLPPLTGIIVKKAIAYMNTWARKPLTRWKIADAVNISEDYLTRIFRKEVGISPWEYLNRYRIQLASALLASTGLSMGDVARETGFQDQAYFCRVFKKIKGISPRQLRRMS